MEQDKLAEAGSWKSETDGKKATDGKPGLATGMTEPDTPVLGAEVVTDRSPVKSIAFLILAIILFVISVNLRKSLSPFFLNPSTIDFSALHLFYAYPPGSESTIMGQLIPRYFNSFVPGYIFSTLLFAGSVIFAVMGLKGISNRKNEDVLGRIISFAGKKQFLFCLLLFVLTVLPLIYLQDRYIGENFSSLDEFSYLFQAHVLREGRLFLESPQPVDAFQVSNVVNNGKWFSKYTIGFPLLLTAGVLFNMPWTVNCILAGLAVVAAFLAGKEVYDIKTGILAALLLAFSPMFTLNSMGLFPHVGHLLFLLLFTFLFFRTVKTEGKWFHALFAGLTLGFAVFIRPAEPVLYGLLFFLYGMFMIIKEKGRRDELAVSFLFTTLGFALMAGLLLLVNKAQTGSLTTFAYNVYTKGESLGFGVYEHNAMKGVWNLLFSASRLFIWVAAAGAELAIISLFEKKRESRFFLLMVIATVILYFLFFSIGEVEYGPRYYFAMLGFLILPAARGIVFLQERIREKAGNSTLISVFSLMAVLFAVLAQYPAMLGTSYTHIHAIPQYKVKTVAERGIPAGENAVVTVRSYPGFTAFGQTTNLPEFNERILWSIFLDSRTNDEVRRKFPDRKFYLLDFNESRGNFVLKPDYTVPFAERPVEMQVDDLAVSGMNYLKSVKNKDKALEQFNRALELSPGNPVVLLWRAGAFMDMGNFSSAASDLQEIGKKNPEIPGIWFALGICNEKQGNKKEARECFLRFLKLAPNDGNALRAKLWADYLSTGSARY